MIDLESSCRELIDCQVELVSEWARLFGLDIVLTDAPPTGRIKVASGDWTFRRHGSGVCFTHEPSTRRVDVHDNFDKPELFDAWRLELFLESQGVLFRGRKLAEALNDVPVIKPVGRHFKFTSENNSNHSRPSPGTARDARSGP
ncbi:DUF6896 domain-containing protein [Maricaulis sp.]|uniref:DUF6896 domain-containing protein n=1 Tax=Maricaulis sp. TaxID=1486257 RepID=UPI002B27662D|nr:hypothetical protein [Maricaulis sp.]